MPDTSLTADGGKSSVSSSLDAIPSASADAGTTGAIAVVLVDVVGCGRVKQENARVFMVRGSLQAWRGGRGTV